MKRLLVGLIALHATFAHALLHRDDWRGSMVCASLLSAAKDARLRHVGATDPAEHVVVNLELTGSADVAAFFAKVDAAESALVTEARRVRGAPAEVSWRALRDFFGQNALYVYSPLWAYFGAKITLGLGLALPLVVSGQSPAGIGTYALVVAGAAVAGAVDYPVRWLRAYDRGLPRLRRAYARFKAENQTSFEFRHEVRVTEALLTTLRRPRVATWADLHAQNVAEETPFTWWVLFGDEPAKVRRLKVHLRVDRDAGLRLLIIEPQL